MCVSILICPYLFNSYHIFLFSLLSTYPQITYITNPTNLSTNLSTNPSTNTPQDFITHQLAFKVSYRQYILKKKRSGEMAADAPTPAAPRLPTFRSLGKLYVCVLLYVFRYVCIYIVLGFL